MAACENKIAAIHAFPPDSQPAADRRMTLTIQCREPAEYSSSFRGVGTSRHRDGAQIRVFGLCENHRQLFEQIDSELVQDHSWARSLTSKSVQI
jgi:hypothetical protein